MSDTFVMLPRSLEMSHMVSLFLKLDSQCWAKSIYTHAPCFRVCVMSARLIRSIQASLYTSISRARSP